jgi:anti-sigma factor RsiW
MEDEPMSHQPFEEWILSDEALTLEQHQALKAHLGECTACAGLATSLAAVERTLGEAEVVAAQAGFGLRFAQRLERRRVRDARRQAWGTFAAAMVAAAVLVAPMAWWLGTAWTSPGDMLVQTLIRIYDLWVGLRVVGGFTRAVVSNVSELVPPAWVLGFLAACLGTGVVWMTVLYRFAFRRVKEGVAR